MTLHELPLSMLTLQTVTLEDAGDEDAPVVVTAIDGGQFAEAGLGVRREVYSWRRPSDSSRERAESAL